MFLRRNRKRVGGETYEYWTLVESVRTPRGPRQRIVATLGKLPGLDEDERAGWEEITRLLDGRARDRKQIDLFRATPEPPQWAQVNLSDVRVERVRQFGSVYLALALWRRLGLHSFFEENVRQGRERIGIDDEWINEVVASAAGSCSHPIHKNILEIRGTKIVDIQPTQKAVHRAEEEGIHE